MKIYKLIQNSTGYNPYPLLKIITYPESPESNMEVFYGNSEKSIIPNNEIYIYIIGQIHSKKISVDLAKEIIADYPHLFEGKKIEFETKLSASRNSLFSHLGKYKTYAEEQLKALEEKIETNKDYPIVIKYKIQRAELFANSGHYDIAKEAYETLRVSYGKKHDGYCYKIKEGIKRCESEIKKASVVFQTPYIVSVASVIVSAVA